MSVAASVPTIVAGTSRLSASATVTSRTFSPTTWAFVTTYPSADTTTPEPRLSERRSRDMSWSPKK